MSESLDFIRQKLSELARHHFGRDIEFSESILVEDNRYCGHRFQGQSLVATWRIKQATCLVLLNGRPLTSIVLPEELLATKAA